MIGYKILRKTEDNKLISPYVDSALASITYEYNKKIISDTPIFVYHKVQSGYGNLVCVKCIYEEYTDFFNFQVTSWGKCTYILFGTLQAHSFVRFMKEYIKNYYPTEYEDLYEILNTESISAVKRFWLTNKPKYGDILSSFHCKHILTTTYILLSQNLAKTITIVKD